MGVLQRLGTRLDTWGGQARMKRFREGWPGRTSHDVAFYRTPSVQYRYRVAGSGKTIVFTADPPMTLEVYDDLLNIFAQRFRVIVVEMPAMGFSATRGDFSFGFRDTNDDLALFLRHVAGLDAVFAFSCVGGLAALDIAARQPDLCSHLALIQVGDVAAFARWKAGRDPKGVLARPVIGQMVMKRLAPKRMPQWYALSVGQSQQIERFCDCARTSFQHGALWSLASAYQVYMDAGVNLAPPQRPILSLWGTADRSHPEINVHSLRHLAPGLACESYADLGHTPELEDPARVLASIERFLSR
jgi:pimeloyl-ACP methyl ester carboxylesterase